MTPPSSSSARFWLCSRSSSRAWFATEWCAAEPGFQAQPGVPWFVLLGLPVYRPCQLFEWWFWYEAYAPAVQGRCNRAFKRYRRLRRYDHRLAVARTTEPPRHALGQRPRPRDPDLLVLDRFGRHSRYRGRELAIDRRLAGEILALPTVQLDRPPVGPRHNQPIGARQSGPRRQIRRCRTFS